VRQGRFSIEGKLGFVVGVVAVVAAVVAGVCVRMLGDIAPGVALALLVTLPAGLYALHFIWRPTARMLRAVGDGMGRLKDRDFSASLADVPDAELGTLVLQYNALSEIMRDERQTLHQRELLLDTVIQATPLALVLTNAARRIMYANIAARALFSDGKPLEGLALYELLVHAPEALREAVQRGEDGIFTVAMAGQNEAFHLSHRRFALNAQSHHLYLFKQLTQELNRQEVATWKKVIRVISHELNNSLAPLSSLAHSGKLIAGNPSRERLELIFSTIEERSDHLKRFIEGYARFAKLPRPQSQHVPWPAFVESLRETVVFERVGALPTTPGYFDAAQLEQVLINLMKNAHESGSAAEEVRLEIQSNALGTRIRILDRGSGMSQQVLESALLPFYSTKRSGTGLGLPLSREIVEAHGGRLSLANRGDGGGLEVALWLPEAPPAVTEGRGAGLTREPAGEA
jgi:nitrogen fixation/metabolism regulation signal transduction histidine kinase